MIPFSDTGNGIGHILNYVMNLWCEIRVELFFKILIVPVVN